MITIRDLHKTLGGKPVLRGVNLEVRKGETIVIVGGSGCGKSVLLKHIMGIMRPDSGTVAIDGTDITHLPEKELNTVRRRIGMLFQGAALFDSLTVAENVSFALDEHLRLPPDRTRQIVSEKLGRVGLLGAELLMPAELSGGMKKRIGLARAIATEPEIILYDEPTTGLDPIMADVINELILKMQKELGVTSVVVTHDMTSAFKVGNRVAMLYEGKIEETGEIEAIRNTGNPVVK
ncbi:MAG: ABC transporter ATP-binding protein, partial [Planctomycetota bacterium]|nr:ABC transporter ATP-binding protein [Planctomycetota bacterium]